MSRFGGGNRQEKKKNVIEKLKVFFKNISVYNKNKNYYFVILAQRLSSQKKRSSRFLRYFQAS